MAKHQALPGQGRQVGCLDHRMFKRLEPGQVQIHITVAQIVR